MTYATIATIRQNAQLRERVTACAATQGKPDPDAWAMQNAWPLATQPGWAEKWEAAIAAHPNEPSYLPGADEDVLTDAMILDAVQSITTTASRQADEDPEEE